MHHTQCYAQSAKILEFKVKIFLVFNSKISSSKGGYKEIGHRCMANSSKMNLLNDLYINIEKYDW